MERVITGGTRVVLDATMPEAALDRPIFAVNWFNTRFSWLYDIYNAAASRSLFAVGAKVFFKGHVVETILGDAGDARQVLLVINYPSGERFLELLSGRVFQLVSVLRVLAVRDFSFAINERVAGPDLLSERIQSFDEHRAWAVFHFSSEGRIRGDLASLAAIAAAHGVEIHFASQRVAVVKTRRRDGKPGRIDSVTDKVVIFEAESDQSLREAVSSAEFEDFVRAQRTPYVGLLRRVL